MKRRRIFFGIVNIVALLLVFFSALFLIVDRR